MPGEVCNVGDLLQRFVALGVPQEFFVCVDNSVDAHSFLIAFRNAPAIVVNFV